MNPKRWGFLLTLWVCLFAFSAHAQSVTVLAFSGDRNARVRGQVYTALFRAKKAKLIPIQRYKAIAAKHGFKGGRAMTIEALTEVAPILKIDAVVEGTVEETFFVRILDAGGNELWAKDLPLKKGLISRLNARRLAAAVYTAAKIAAKAPKTLEPASPDELKPTEVEEPPKLETEPAPSAPVSKDSPPLPKIVPPDPPKNETAKQRARRQRAEMAESHTATGAERQPKDEAEAEAEKAEHSRKAPHIGPKLITVQLAGVTTWRSYCARPGVTSCGAYDALPVDQQPAGERVDFRADVPYLGIGGAVELFPFARSEGWIKGIGLGGSYSRGFSLTRVSVSAVGTSTGEGEEVVSVDQAYSIYLAPRWYYGRGKNRQRPLVGYVGGRLGISGRDFEVDPSAAVALPGSHRSYPVIGVDGAFPLLKQLRLEAGASLFIKPNAGQEERALYGAQVSSNGFGLEAGAAGDLWGPFGYALKLRYSIFNDQFSGGGSRWVGVNSGAARETYVSFIWGLTTHY